jgi:hypothetical protein
MTLITTETPGPPRPPNVDAIVDALQAIARQRRFAIKVQQKLDRALESYVRINYTDWSPDLPEKERDKENAKVTKLIKAAAADDGDPDLIELVKITALSRSAWDQKRDNATKAMEKLAAKLPVAAWVKGVHGIGILGLALILAETGKTGSLSNYSNPAKLWKRLGFAPYDGYAGSTWKRDSWRPRALTKEEWTDNPFSGARYATMQQLATHLVDHQWIGAKKTEDGEGRPKPGAVYGEFYAARRARTLVTHADWSDGHRRSDALRVTFKEFLKDLWVEWHRLDGLG